MSISRFELVAKKILESKHVRTDLIPQNSAHLDGRILRYRIYKLDRSGAIKVRNHAPVSRRAWVELNELETPLLEHAEEAG